MLPLAQPPLAQPPRFEWEHSPKTLLVASAMLSNTALMVSMCGRRNLSGFGTEVMLLVDVRISLRISSSAGRCSAALGSYSIQRKGAGGEMFEEKEEIRREERGWGGERRRAAVLISVFEQALWCNGVRAVGEAAAAFQPRAGGTGI